VKSPQFKQQRHAQRVNKRVAKVARQQRKEHERRSRRAAALQLTPSTMSISQARNIVGMTRQASILAKMGLLSLHR
jgi:hypothetical protein